MRKKLSKIITLLFILATTLGGTVSSRALEEPSAIAPAKGSLTIHKYLYNVDGIDVGDGKEISDVGELNGKEIRGVQFDVYKVGAKVTAGAPDVVPGGAEWSYSISSDKTKLVATNGASTYEYSIGSKLNNGTDSKTDNDGSIKLKELDRGYYFVVENLGDSDPEIKNGENWEKIAITTPAKPFVVAVPMTDPDDEASWITDVHVYPKNQTTDVVKEPSKPSVNVGETFNWSIAVEIPAGIKDYQKFIVTDTLDEALTYTADSVKVYQAEKSGDKWIKSSPENQLSSFGSNFTAETNTLTVDLISGKEEMANWEGLIIEFETKVNGKLEGKEVNIIGNKATVDFTNKEGQDSKKESDESEVNVGDIIIDKVDKDGKELSGAEFQIARTEKEAKDGNFIKITKDSDGKISGFVYPGADGYNDALDWIVKPNSETEGDFKKFEGLETHTIKSDGTPDYKTYWVVETKAPDEYNLVGDPIEVNFENSEKVDDRLTYNLTRKVVNSKGFTLPNTGGIGTMLLVVVGIVLIGLAVILTMNKNKKNA